MELTSVIALENMRGRFNLALGVGAAGFSEGMVCALPATATEPRHVDDLDARSDTAATYFLVKCHSNVTVIWYAIYQELGRRV